MTEGHRLHQDGYAYLSDCGLQELAWEFLRRNDDFRAAWAAYQEVNAEFRNIVEIERYDLPDFRRRRAIALEAASRPWGLLRPCDPDRNALTARPEWRAGDLGSGVSMFADDYDPPPSEQDEKGDARLVTVYLQTGPIDLRKAIKPQIRAIEAMALCEQRRLKQQHPELVRDPTKTSGTERRIQKEPLPKYLRAYDVRMADATFQQIGELFMPDATYYHQGTTGKRYYEAACTYVEGGYRTLLLKA